MKLSECNLVQLAEQKRHLKETSDSEWRQSIPYKERMREINRCIKVLKLHKPCVRRSAYEKLTAKEKRIYDSVMSHFPATSHESALDAAWSGGVKFNVIPT